MTSPELDHYRRLFGAPRLRRLDRGSLPTPLRYLTEQSLLIGKARGDSATIRCPSHKGGDETHPSLIVSLVDGHFRCMTCGARGGDILELHRLRTGFGFREAVLDLGARFRNV